MAARPRTAISALSGSCAGWQFVKVTGQSRVRFAPNCTTRQGANGSGNLRQASQQNSPLEGGCYEVVSLGTSSGICQWITATSVCKRGYIVATRASSLVPGSSDNASTGLASDSATADGQPCRVWARWFARVAAVSAPRSAPVRMPGRVIKNVFVAVLWLPVARLAKSECVSSSPCVPSPDAVENYSIGCCCWLASH